MPRYYMEVNDDYDAERNGNDHTEAVSNLFKDAKRIDLTGVDDDENIGRPYLIFNVIDKAGQTNFVKVFDEEADDV